MRKRRVEPEEKFRVVVADPAWPFRDKLPGATRGAGKNYALMALQSIEDYLAVSGIANRIADDAVLFLWRVSAMQREALSVMDAWGFEQKSEVVWAKTNVPDKEVELRLAKLVERGAAMADLLAEARKLHFGMGRYTRAAHETCLIGRRGKFAVYGRSERSVFYAPVREHSRKPEEFFELVERMARGPYLELFAAGHTRPGWTCSGDPHRATA